MAWQFTFLGKTGLAPCAIVTAKQGEELPWF
jgi:hypothetical protein